MSEIGTGQGNFSHRGRCEKVQGKFKVGASTYSLQRQDEAIRDGHGEIQPDPVRLGRFMETSPTAVGVRKFREGSEGERLLQPVNVNESQTGHVRETSPTGVGVRKFRESSGQVR